MKPALVREEDGTLAYYAWPGGYPMMYTTNEGNVLDAKCANEPGFSDEIVSGDINWEDHNLICDGCNQPIESAY
jgi:hypothetical protein